MFSVDKAKLTPNGMARQTSWEAVRSDLRDNKDTIANVMYYMYSR